MQGEENKHTNMSSTRKGQTFKLRPSLSMRRKLVKMPREENKHTNRPLNPKDGTFKSKIETFKLKINL